MQWFRYFTLVTTFLLAGCSPRLADERQVSLEVGEIKTIAVAAIGHPQTIHVSASSPGAPIHVHVYLPEHEEEIERMITFGKTPENVIASGSGAEQIRLDATIPASKEAIVRLAPAGRTAANVQLTITN